MNPDRFHDKIYRFPVSRTEGVDFIVQAPEIRAQGLPLTLWPATYLLAGLLHRLDIKLPQSDGQNIPILELGAGTGIAGIVGAMVWHRHAVVTDLKEVVPGLMMNIDQNSKSLQTHGGTAIAGELDWDKPQSLILADGRQVDASRSKASIILAADVVYGEDLPAMLCQTILAWLAPGPDSRVILTLALRIAHLDWITEVWTLLENGGLEVVAEGKEDVAEVDVPWDDEKLIEWSVWRWKS